ncbi:MAG: transposase domain-containing protein [Chitinophagaceae bacterium]
MKFRSCNRVLQSLCSTYIARAINIVTAYSIHVISYTLKIWDRLMVYTTDGPLLPDTNLVENALRPVTLGRKNYMFAGNEDEAQRGAIFYSLLETCKKNDVDPYTWLRDFYTRISTHPINRLRELLPSVWKQLREEGQTKPVTQ